MHSVPDVCDCHHNHLDHPSTCADAMLVFGFILMYAMSNIFEVVIFILHSFWVPQIFCNASRDCRGAISKYVRQFVARQR